jgi:hypothetical protein
MKLEKQNQSGGDHESGQRHEKFYKNWAAKQQVGGNKRARIVWPTARAHVRATEQKVASAGGTGSLGHHFLLDVYLFRAVPLPRRIGTEVDWVLQSGADRHCGFFGPSFGPPVRCGGD